MMPVPPPKILELETAVALTPLKVTLVMFAFVEELFSQATPMMTMRSVPLPSVCDHDRDDMPVVDAVRLAASNEMDANARVGKRQISSASGAKRARAGQKWCMSFMSRKFIFTSLNIM